MALEIVISQHSLQLLFTINSKLYKNGKRNRLNFHDFVVFWVIPVKIHPQQKTFRYIRISHFVAYVKKSLSVQ